MKPLEKENWRAFMPEIDKECDLTYWTIEAEDGLLPEGFRLTGFISPRHARLVAAAPRLLRSLKELLLLIGLEGEEGSRIARANALVTELETLDPQPASQEPS